MSFKPEVKTDDTGKWYGNALRFPTRDEAEAQIHDLMTRWFAVRDTRVVESGDPVNYRYIHGHLESVEAAAEPVAERRRTLTSVLKLNPAWAIPCGVFLFGDEYGRRAETTNTLNPIPLMEV